MVIHSSCDSAVDTHGYGTTHTFREIKSLLGSLLLQDHDYIMEQPSQTQIAAAITELQTEVRRQAKVIQN